MKEANNIKFLGLELDKYMNWKNHIGKILPIMSSECYVNRSMYHLSSKTTLKMIYFAYFQSVMEYRIAFWGGIAISIFGDINIAFAIHTFLDTAFATKYGKLYMQLYSSWN
jgi:hypothetical protein